MESRPSRRGVFPGSFNPLTVAHLAMAERALDEHALDCIDLVISRVTIDKPDPPGPPLDERVALIAKDLADKPWLSVALTDLQMIVDIADGYDAVIMGADKWAQVNDVAYYESVEARDAALERLPRVIVAARSGADVPDELRLEIGDALQHVSSTKARAGDRSMMAPKAAEEWRDT